MTAWEFLIDLHSICHFMSKERSGKASNSELKRWLKNQSVVINGRRIKWDDEVDFPVNECILFPKRNRITLY